KRPDEITALVAGSSGSILINTPLQRGGPAYEAKSTVLTVSAREPSITLPARFDIREVKRQKHPKPQLKVKPIAPRERHQQHRRHQSLRPIRRLRDADVHTREPNRSNGYNYPVRHIILFFIAHRLCL